ncbi:MAG TPA: kelch repeat-containing protein [Candidatus Limnocylindrales bacterium]|nr:kelch repeat-containing protein [Candidatus Limnocylindrales bacterium]
MDRALHRDFTLGARLARHGARRRDGHIVLFGGGADRDGYTAQTWLFDPAIDRWTEAPATGTRAGLTLTSEGCGFEGPMQFTAGELSIAALNETTDGGNDQRWSEGAYRSCPQTCLLGHVFGPGYPRPSAAVTARRNQVANP